VDVWTPATTGSSSPMVRAEQDRNFTFRRPLMLPPGGYQVADERCANRRRPGRCGPSASTRGRTCATSGSPAGHYRVNTSRRADLVQGPADRPALSASIRAAPTSSIGRRRSGLRLAPDGQGLGAGKVDLPTPNMTIRDQAVLWIAATRATARASSSTTAMTSGSSLSTVRAQD